MQIRTLLAIAATASILSAPTVLAQFSKSTVSSQINSQFPDNTTGQITPATTRAFLNNLVNSYQQFASINPQAGTTYSIQISDYGKLITFSGGNVSVALSPASTTGFTSFNFYATNVTSGNVVITPSSGTICGNSALTLNNTISAWVISDGTNYQCLYGFAGNVANGNSGGVLYFNTASSLASSATLAANDVIVGGGSGNPPITGQGCSLTSSVFTCGGSSSSLPQIVLSNAANDNTSSVIIYQKSRGINPVTTSDSVFDIQAQGFASSGFRAAGREQYIATGISGTNLAAKWNNSTSSLSSALGNILTFDNNGHIYTTLPSAPTSSNCGTSPSITSGSTDNAGSIVVGTGTPSTCVVRFAASWTAAPKCLIGSSPILLSFANTIGATTLTIVQSPTNSNTITWHCGLGNG